MFSLCANMKWSHLPVAGGMYDQDPDLLDKFEYIFQELGKEEARKDAERKKKDDAEAAKSKNKSSSRRGRRR
jgi:hypothetical protein